MDFELLVTFEEREEDRVSAQLWTARWGSQNTAADVTIKMFSLTGEGRKEVEFILMSSGEVHQEGPGAPPSRDAWTPNQKEREPRSRFVKAVGPTGFLLLEN